MKKYALLFLSFPIIFLGCSSLPTSENNQPAQISSSAPEDDSGQVSSTGIDLDSMIDGEAIIDDIPSEPLVNIIYFDFDESNLRDEYTDILLQHASKLGNNSMIEVRLKGHADERGAREYNIGLGERRSQAVRRTLMLEGVSSDQLTTVSFGEERPVVFGNDEESYSLNRRVEIKYIN